MPIIIDSKEDVKAAVYGGAFFGGGGGGSINDGLKLGFETLREGKIKIYDVNELKDDINIITVSAVGAPAAKTSFLKPEYLVRAIELLQKIGVEVDGLMTSENGGFNTINGWYQSVKLNIPIIDAACDCRAHPTGLMGSLGLHRVKGYISIQSAVGGNPNENRYLEIVVKGSLLKAASIIRKASIEAGGVVGVARNPVKLNYVKKNAAVGAVKLAIRVGREIIKTINSGDIYFGYRSIADMFNGDVIDEVIVSEKRLEAKEGFDVGYLKLKSSTDEYTVTFVNEYLTLEKKSNRIATFPDLISLIDLNSGLPISSAEIKRGMRCLIVVVPRNNLILSSGLLYSEVYEPLEKAINKPIINFIKDILLE